VSVNLTIVSSAVKVTLATNLHKYKCMQQQFILFGTLWNSSPRTYLTPAENVLPGHNYVEVSEHFFQLILQYVWHHRVAVSWGYMLIQLDNTHLHSLYNC